LDTHPTITIFKGSVAILVRAGATEDQAKAIIGRLFMEKLIFKTKGGDTHDYSVTH